MDAVSQTHQKIPFGVGQIISDSFAIFFENAFRVMIIGFAYPFILFLVNGLVVGFNASSVATNPNSLPIGQGVAIWGIMSFLLSSLCYALITGMVVHLAYDARQGTQRSIGAYFSSVFPSILPIAVLSTAAAILATMGLLAFIVGGLWVYAVLCVIVPAAVIERAGFSAWGRSVFLTKEYRWSIVGMLVVMGLLGILIGFVISLVLGFIVALLASAPILATLLSGVLNALLSGLTFGIGGIMIALTYARLREIKEGVNVDEIAAVFE